MAPIGDPKKSEPSAVRQFNATALAKEFEDARIAEGIAWEMLNEKDRASLIKICQRIIDSLHAQNVIK
jgi:hypothetical protein